MKKSKSFLIFSFIIISMPMLLFAREDLKTDWLESAPGSNGALLGAKIIDVEKSKGMTIIEIELPIKDLKDYDTIIVVDKNDQQPATQTQAMEWMQHKDEDAYGIRI